MELLPGVPVPPVPVPDPVPEPVLPVDPVVLSVLPGVAELPAALPDVPPEPVVLSVLPVGPVGPGVGVVVVELPLLVVPEVLVPLSRLQALRARAAATASMRAPMRGVRVGKDMSGFPW